MEESVWPKGKLRVFLALQRAGYVRMLISTRAIHKNELVYASGCERNGKAAEIKMETLGTTDTKMSTCMGGYVGMILSPDCL